MASIANAFRRGSIYWWRRRVAWGPVGQLPITLSMRTTSPREARFRSAALSVEFERLRRMIERGGAPKFSLTASEWSGLYRSFLDRYLGEMLADEQGSISSPEDRERHRAAMLEIYRVAAKTGGRAQIAEPELADMRARGVPERTAALARTLAAIGGTGPQPGDEAVDAGRDGVWRWWVSADERVTEDPLRSKVRPDIRAELDKAREAGDLRAYRAVVRRLAAERCLTRGDAKTRSNCQMSG